MVLRIPLNKRSKKNVGRFEAIVSDEDKDLAGFNWSISYGYAMARIDGKSRRMHQIIAERMQNGNPLENGKIPDHINGNKLDNRRANLRIVTPFQNSANQGKHKDNTSGYKGVSWSQSHKKWLAQFKFDGKSFFVGRFDTKEDAYKAYCKKAKEIQGEFFRGGEDENA